MDLLWKANWTVGVLRKVAFSLELCLLEQFCLKNNVQKRGRSIVNTCYV